MTNLTTIKRDYERALAKLGIVPKRSAAQRRHRRVKQRKRPPQLQRPQRAKIGPFGELGTIIRTEREGRGLTLAGFAEPIGVARQSVCHWEQGRSIPRPITIRRISGVWDIPLVDLALAAANSLPHRKTP